MQWYIWAQDKREGVPYGLCTMLLEAAFIFLIYLFVVTGISPKSSYMQGNTCSKDLETAKSQP